METQKPKEYSHQGSSERFRNFGAFFANSSEIIKQFTDETVRLEAIAEASSRDKDTGLYTKSTFMEKVQSWIDSKSEIENAGEEDVMIAFLDMNSFGLINKEFGHARGDIAIKVAAEVLESSLNREGDTAARFGGDEFIAFFTRFSKTAHGQSLGDYLNSRLIERVESTPSLAFMKNTSFAVGTVVANLRDLSQIEDGLSQALDIADENMRANKLDMKKGNDTPHIAL